MREVFFYAIVMGVLASAGDPVPETLLVERQASVVQQSVEGGASAAPSITKF